jgi:hypothetical protein
MPKRSKPIVQGFERTSSRTASDDLFKNGGATDAGDNGSSDDDRSKDEDDKTDRE